MCGMQTVYQPSQPISSLAAEQMASLEHQVILSPGLPEFELGRTT